VRALARELWAGRLSGAVASTLHAYAEGLALAVAIGILAGVAIASSRILLDASSVVVEFLRTVPGIALIPLAILWFGLGLAMQRFVVAYAATWPILIATLYAVRGTDRLLHDVARTTGARRVETAVRVTLPAALPGIAAGVRLSAAIALQVAVTVEFLNGGGGIGGYMQRQQLSYHLPELYGAILLTALVGYAVHLSLRAVERRALFWVGEHRLEAR
jgi:ABC-type nitrate/sulfonate/bicarbonate transport system permease component